MLDRFDSFKSHSMIEIQILVKSYYTFYQWLDISTYITDLLNKNKYLYNNIANVGN